LLAKKRAEDYHKMSFWTWFRISLIENVWGGTDPELDSGWQYWDVIFSLFHRRWK